MKNYTLMMISEIEKTIDSYEKDMIFLNKLKHQNINAEINIIIKGIYLDLIKLTDKENERIKYLELTNDF